MAETTVRMRDVYQGVDTLSMGYKMLAAMGWREGEGLGSKKQGIKTHIRATKKFDNSGVGAKEAAARAHDWTLSMHSYTQVLNSLTEVTSSHALRSKEAADSPGEQAAEQKGGATAKPKATKKRKLKDAQRATVREDDGEEEAASEPQQPVAQPSREAADCSEEPTAKRKGSTTAKSKTSKKRKIKDVEKNAPVREDVAEEEAPPAKQQKVASHAGRYRKREVNKLVKGYSAGDLAAILGQAAPVALPEVTRQPAVSSASDTPGSEDAVPQGAPRKRKSKKSRVDTAEQPPTKAPAPPVARSLAAEQSAIVKVEDKPEDSTAWWRTLFHRAGVVGAQPTQPSKSATKEAPITVHGFSEQDQTDLYNRAQSNQTKGRVGLGQSSAPKKIGGARWQGKRTVLGSDSEDED